MTKILGVDVGTKRTGLAAIDTSAIGFILPLPLLQHASETELLQAIETLVQERSIDLVVFGIPYLSSGQEGAQAKKTRSIAARLEKKGIRVATQDERYTSIRSSPRLHRKHGGSTEPVDADSMAAIAILECFLGC